MLLVVRIMLQRMLYIASIIVNNSGDANSVQRMLNSERAATSWQRMNYSATSEPKI